ncbi:MAG: PASTA domain-containing protein [Clostridia bacterium]|nr:PASTA domain-containing protein [Clostridia bacterium]
MKTIDKNKKTGSPHSAKRILITAIAFSLLASYLIINLFRLQYIKYDYYTDKTYDQITMSSTLKANRGNIYDANMNILATTKTVWRVFISTREIAKREKADGVKYSEIIAEGLSQILSLNYEKLLSKIQGSRVLDVTVKKAASEAEYKKVLSFIQSKGLGELVFTEAESSRYYPEGTLAAHVLGFVGSDNQGLYGLEYSYNSTLSGQDGYYLYAKDANGNALPGEYSAYVEAVDGNSIVTTIDSYVQAALESELEKIRVNHSVKNRVTGIVMDTSTGAILAMATSSPFNPNSPYELDGESLAKLNASGLTVGSEEYRDYKISLMQTMWSNKAVSETYEPGSTFKIVTVSTALDLGVASFSDRFSCHGYYNVGGWRIKCHKITGHGSGFTLAYGLQMSCNPTMMALSERIGAESFYKYIEAFGYFEKTGIDLPSEASTIFHKLENIGSTELATISFGQRFKVSIIGHLTAIAAVANGGKLVTPYVVEKVLDKDGKCVDTHQVEVRRQVIRENIATAMYEVLEEGVSGEGGAKNAYVEGYKVAAKTGTSQKFDVLDANGNSYLRIGSTVAYVPGDGTGVAVIIVVDEPTTAVKYGSVVAAPYISSLLTNVLPYLEFDKSSETTPIQLESYVGMNVATAKEKLKALGVEYEIIGSGETVIHQVPNDSIGDTAIKKVILYTEDKDVFEIKVPSVIGKSAEECNRILTNLGLNVKIIGNVDTSADTQTRVIAQSIPEGTVVKTGTTVSVTIINYDFED